MKTYLGERQLPSRINFAKDFNYNNLRKSVRLAAEETYNYMTNKENFELFIDIY